MNRGVFGLSIVWLVTFISSVYLYFQSSDLPQPDGYVAMARQKEGDAFYRAPFSSSWRRVSTGMQFAAGTMISTQSKANVILETKDGDILRVGSGSQIVLSGLDRDERSKSLIFLVNGTLSVQPDIPKELPKNRFTQRLPEVARLIDKLSTTIKNTPSNDIRKVEVAVAGLHFDMTRSRAPVVISSNQEQVNILTKDNNITARRGDKEIGKLPTDKALVIQPKSQDIKISESSQGERLKELNSIAKQTELLAREIQSAERYKSTKTPSKNDSEMKVNSGNKTSTIANESSQMLALLEPLSPSSQSAIEPTIVTGQSKNQEGSVSKEPTAQTPESDIKKDELKKTTPAPTGNVERKAKPSTTDNKATASTTPTATTAEPLSSKSIKKNNNPIAKLPEKTTPPQPADKLWQLVNPKDETEMLLLNRSSLSALDSLNFQFDYVGPNTVKPERPNLEVFNKRHPEASLLLKATGATDRVKVAEFKLTGVQFSQLLAKSKGDTSFAYRVRSNTEGGESSLPVKQAQSIDLRIIDELPEAGYTVSTSGYQVLSSNAPRTPLVIAKESPVQEKDRIQFVTSNRSALGHIFSRLTLGPSTSMTRAAQQPEGVIGTHFYDSSGLMFSFYPANKAEESFKNDWLSGTAGRAFFEGRFSDIILPNSIPSLVHGGDPGQTIRVLSDGEVLKTKIAVLQTWPGVARRLSLNRIPMFNVNGNLKTSGLKSQASESVAPPLSFSQSKFQEKSANLVTILTDANGKVTFPTLEQIGFAIPTLFKTVPRPLIEKTIRERNIKIDKTLLDSPSGRSLFEIVNSELRADLLLFVFEQSDGELVSELVGKGSPEDILSRSFTVHAISELQRKFFSSLGYDGVVSGADRRWISLSSQNATPTRGQWAALYIKAQQEIWLPAIGRYEAPSALAQCEVVQPRGCWARVFAIEKEASGESLIGVKSKWL